MSNLKWLNSNYDKVLREDDSLVNMEIDRLKEENEQLHNKVSELTEALDAAHVFCEGVKEHYIKKACEWLKDNNGKRFNGFDIVYTQGFIKAFQEALKGE